MNNENIPFYERLEFYIFFFILIILSFYFIPKFFKEKTIIYKTCDFDYPKKPTVILRLDDIQNAYGNVQQTIIDDLLKQNKPISLAVIPSKLKRNKIAKYLNKIKNDKNIEISQHGLSHKSYEFQNLSYDKSYASIFEGKKLIKDILNVVPITFVPPSNAYNNNTIEALKNLNFKIISADDIRFDDKILFLGKNTQTADYSYTNESNLPITYNYTYVSARCKSILNLTNLCIIMIHPQDFVDSSKKKLDNHKYSQFVTLLEKLDQIQNIQYSTFKDLIRCVK